MYCVCSVISFSFESAANEIAWLWEPKTWQKRRNMIYRSSVLRNFTISVCRNYQEAQSALRIETLPFYRKKRYLVVLLAFFGFFNVYALRVNLSVAIVAMTEIRTIEHANGSITYEQYFDWDSRDKGLVLSSFFYGYICTQFVGGYLGYRFGGVKIFAMGIGVTALLTLLTPLAAKTSLTLLLTVRIIEGIFEGLTFPCMYDVWSKWAPPLERTRMAGFAIAGNYVGTVVAMPASGLLASTLGWESNFEALIIFKNFSDVFL